MKLKNPRKTLSKGALIAALFLSNVVVATEQPDLQRRDSFKKLEDLRAEEKEKDGEQVFYTRRDGELRPYGLMNDITEPGQSTKEIKEKKDLENFHLNADESLPQRVEEEPLTETERRELDKIIKKGKGNIKRHQDIVQNKYKKKQNAERRAEQNAERRDAYSKMPQEYEQGAPDIDGRYRNAAEQSIRQHQDAVQNQERVSLRNFMRMNKEQIKNVREVVVPLSESYARSPFNNRGVDLYPFDKNLQENPDITVILDCAGATKIDDKCLAGLSKMRKIDIINADKVTSIGDDFLSSCSDLRKIDLSPLFNVTNVGDGFLSSCGKLTTLDLRSFSKVTDIGSGFLNCCNGLTSLDLRPLLNVKNISHNFLKDCSGLKRETITVLPENLSLVKALSEREQYS
ncbi:MAG: hypothetical protein NEHIOOID_01260 [Holosporales bacterium]